ncbi:MAG: hypothetical protein GY832_06165 [Chloroflexi bacterium]|nr:hypothetical protein [Chloroflexota bacterium]
MTKPKFRIEQIAPNWPRTWAISEWFYWCQEANDILKKDVDSALFNAAYDSVDWEKYHEQFKDTPFYGWLEEGGILTFGGPRHIEDNCFFSGIGDISSWEGDWLREHPEFNKVLHDVHTETATQMIDFILDRALQNQKRRKRRRKRSKARPESTTFQVGDSVVVRSGTRDPDFDIEIGGWQGRISEIHPAGNQDTVMVAWDSATLRHMPDWVIVQSEEQGLDWTLMGVEIHDVELADPRDTERDVAQAIEALSQEHAWSWLGEEGTRIGEILTGVDPDDKMALLDRWEDHLRRHLRFPFDAEVAEHQERGPLQSGNRVSVQRIFDIDDHYGIIVLVKHRRRQVHFPLCDLEAVDESSPNHEIVMNYAVWFANR